MQLFIDDPSTKDGYNVYSKYTKVLMKLIDNNDKMIGWFDRYPIFLQNYFLQIGLIDVYEVDKENFGWLIPYIDDNSFIHRLVIILSKIKIGIQFETRPYILNILIARSVYQSGNGKRSPTFSNYIQL